MRLELQAANDSMQDKKLTTPLKPRVPSPGACNLCLWARPGRAFPPSEALPLCTHGLVPWGLRFQKSVLARS
eukprot:2630855-Amphidinium_carterae.1